MSVPIEMRNHGFQTAPMPTPQVGLQVERRDQEDRSRELKKRIGVVVGGIIAGVGFIGIVAVPAIAIGVKDNWIVGGLGGLASIGVCFFGIGLVDQAFSNYPCCDHNPRCESDFITV